MWTYNSFAMTNKKSADTLDTAAAEQHVPVFLPVFGALDCPASHLQRDCMEGSGHTALPRWMELLAGPLCWGRSAL